MAGASTEHAVAPGVLGGPLGAVLRERRAELLEVSADLVPARSPKPRVRPEAVPL